MYEVEEITEVVLLKTTFYYGDNHVLTFDSESAKTTFFNSKKQFGKVLENSTFQRKDMYIRAPYNYDEIAGYNYGYFDNNRTGEESRRYYFYITNISYQSEECSFINIMIDAFMTYQNELVYHTSMIERKHVIDDVVGRYTYPEGLEYGDYLIQTQATHSLGQYYFCMAVSTDRLFEKLSGVQLPSNRIYNGVPSGLIYIIFDASTYNLGYAITYYNTEGKEGEIVAIFPIPKAYAPKPYWYKSDELGITWGYIDSSVTRSGYDLGNITINKPTTLGYPQADYTPKNKKLLTYPYTYLLANNNLGGANKYKFELFTSSVKFQAVGVMEIAPSHIYLPQGYKYANQEVNNNWNEMLTSASLPLGSWYNDVFANWFAQNKTSLFLSQLGGLGSMAVSAGLGLVTGSLTTAVGGIMSGLNAFLEVGKQVSVMSEQPNQTSGNTGNNGLLYSASKEGATFYTMTIKPEYAKIIDNFFDMYGYKVMNLEVPNVHTRKKWNYLKAVQMNITGNRNKIPQEYLEEIRTMFLNGVTLWHDYNTMYDYSNDNGVI